MPVSVLQNLVRGVVCCKSLKVFQQVKLEVGLGQCFELGVDVTGSSAIKTFLVYDRESRKAVSNTDISVTDKAVLSSPPHPPPLVFTHCRAHIYSRSTK